MRRRTSITERRNRWSGGWERQTAAAFIRRKKLLWRFHASRVSQLSIQLLHMRMPTKVDGKRSIPYESPCPSSATMERGR